MNIKYNFKVKKSEIFKCFYLVRIMCCGDLNVMLNWGSVQLIVEFIVIYFLFKVMKINIDGKIEKY